MNPVKGNRGNYSNLLAWARKARHPHRECTKALIKRGIPAERAVRICAAMKDDALGTTKWRKGGKRSTG